MTTGTMKAVHVSKTGRDIVEREIPSPEKGEVLIKNVVVSSNPKDWKLPIWLPPYEGIEGNDVAGYVEAVGKEVTAFQKGDKVAAFSKMMTHDKYGAYAEYTISPVNTVFHLGPKTSFEDASTLPLAYMTAAIGLFKRLELPLPDSAPHEQIPLLIYGGSTTVGAFAIQLAKFAGLYVVAIAGKSKDLALAYGADEVIDYRGKSQDQLSEEIAKAVGGKIRYAYDVVSEGGTLETIANAFETNGGKITYTLNYTEEQLAKLPSNITTSRTMVGTAHAEDADFAQDYYEKAGKWLEEGKLKPMKVTVVPGGLGGVAEGLRRLQENEVSGEKLVYRIAETEGLEQKA